MLQTSRLEPWITLVRKDIPLQELEQAYWLGDLSSDDRKLLEKMGYRQFEDDKTKSKEAGIDRLIVAKR